MHGLKEARFREHPHVQQTLMSPSLVPGTCQTLGKHRKSFPITALSSAKETDLQNKENTTSL